MIVHFIPSPGTKFFAELRVFFLLTPKVVFAPLLVARNLCLVLLAFFFLILYILAHFTGAATR